MSDSIPATSSSAVPLNSSTPSVTIANEPASLELESSTNDIEMTAGPVLPSVVPGSEPWHRDFPNNWLPILTRDIRTQEQVSRTSIS